MLPSCIYLSLILCLFSYGIHAQNVEGKWEKTLKPTDSKQKFLKADALPDFSTEASSTVTEDLEPIAVLGITVPSVNESDHVVQDHHIYYNSTFYAEAPDLWIDFDKLPSSHPLTMLSNSHRQATTIELSFDFPFYGHALKNITIATGGFLYMGDYLHNWIAATQYVAPLMANFDTTQATDSVIKYADNGTAFTALWENVYMQDGLKNGAFTFQVTLLQNGDIIFAYKSIPTSPRNISDDRHPVKVGISDAYILERSLFFMKRKTIYEYHRIDLLKRPISNNTAIYLKALPTCVGFKDCRSCTEADPRLDCSWCEAIQRCSDGIDRSRQAWVMNQCSIRKDKCPTNSSDPDAKGGYAAATASSISNREQDARFGPEYQVVTPNAVVDDSRSSQLQREEITPSSGGATIGAIIAIVAFVVAVIVAAVWLGYAYKFPQSPSGQFLIKYRPSQWSVRPKDDSSAISGDARHF